MKPILSERNIVIVLFVLVLTTFVMAQEDSRKMQLVQVAATAVKPQQFLASQESVQQKDVKEVKSSTENSQ